MSDRPTAANVHRYCESAGVSVGKGPTTYLTAKTARELGAALFKVARSIEREKFGDSNIGSIHITEDPALSCILKQKNHLS